MERKIPPTRATIQRRRQVLLHYKTNYAANSLPFEEHLQQIKETPQQLKVSLVQNLKNDVCKKLMKETSITHDAKVRVKPSRATRRAHENDIDLPCPTDHGDLLDVDSSIEAIL